MNKFEKAYLKILKGLVTEQTSKDAAQPAASTEKNVGNRFASQRMEGRKMSRYAKYNAKANYIGQEGYFVAFNFLEYARMLDPEDIVPAFENDSKVIPQYFSEAGYGYQYTGETYCFMKPFMSLESLKEFMKTETENGSTYGEALFGIDGSSIDSMSDEELIEQLRSDSDDDFNCNTTEGSYCFNLYGPGQSNLHSINWMNSSKFFEEIKETIDDMQLDDEEE